MLVKLLPSQISDHWDKISFAIERSLPPIVKESPNKMNNILLSLLDDRLSCWVSCRDYNGNIKVDGVLITKKLVDDVSETSSLLIYCLYSFDWTGKSSWESGYNTLVKYARKIGCSRIVGYTNVKSIAEMVESLGGSSEYMFVSLPV